jgi:glycosyltransferase involved in cell wall biosynthesis
MQKLTYHLPHPTHYHQYFLEKLVETNAYNLNIVYYNAILKEYPWKTNFDFDNQTYVLKKKYFNVDFRYLFKKNNSINFVAGWIEPTMIILLSFWSIFGIPYIIGTDTIIDKNRKGVKQFLRSLWLHKLILKNAISIVTTGNIAVNKIKSLPIGDIQIYNYPFVTNLDFFKPISHRQINNEIIFLSSGRLDIKHKGYDIAIKSLNKLKLNYPTFKFIYKIIGVGPDYNNLVSLIDQFNLKNEVELLGWKEAEALPSLYNSCDFFIHPSYFDPYPNAVLEAMACGNIVIASNTAGSALDRIIDNENGFIFNSGDFDSLYDKLNYVIKLEQSEIQSIKKEARITAESWDFNYNINVLKNITSIYE